MNDLETITKNVFLVYGEGFCSNIYILQDGQKALLIDAGSGNSIPKLDAALAGCKIEKVLLTHGHADHIHGMNYISADGFVSKKDFSILRELNEFMPNYKPPINIDALSEESNSFSFGEFKLKLIETPGHTPGSISLFEEKTKLLFSGDTKFADGGVGRTDLPGGDEAQLMESLRKLEALKYKKLCPGHGPLE